MLKMGVDSMKPMMEKMSASVNKNSDIDMVRDAIPFSIIQLEGLLEISPDNEYFLIMAAQSYSAYSYAFIEDKDKKRAKKLYLKGRDHALRVFRKKKDFIKAISIDTPLDKFILTLEQFGKDDAPALYWNATCWMQYIGISLVNVDVLLDFPKVEAIIHRIIELDEGYYHGFSHLLLGAFYASRPEFIGGEPEKAKYHFKKAFELSKSRVLFVHLFFAQYHTVQIQDKELYIQTLEKILSAPVNLFTEMNFANEVARRKASMLLKEVNDYF